MAGEEVEEDLHPRQPVPPRRRHRPDRHLLRNVLGLEQRHQSAFRDVADALARRGTMGVQLAATERRAAAAADVAMLEEARYQNGIDSYLNLLDAQRSYYSVQQVLIQTKLTSGQNLVTLYQALGGDPLLQTTPICQPLPSDNVASSANVANQCSPI